MYKRRGFSVIFAGMMVLSLVIVLALVYAGFTGQLTINGTAVGRESNWDIHFENVSNITTTGSAKVLNNHQPVINSNNRTEINDYEVSLTSPNDTVSFTFDAVNDGNYNAKVTSVSVGTPQCTSTDSVSAVNMCNNLTYTLTYDSGATVQTNDILYAKDKLSFKVTLKFNDISNPDLLPKAGVSISNLGIQINFEQQGNAEVDENTGIVQNNRVYHQGDKITLNNEDYWVIANSGAGQDYVVALKDLPLTVAEVNLYGGVGTENNHVNRYTAISQGTARNTFGYGGMAYYSSENCGQISGTNKNDCKYDYVSSDIKYVIDTWTTSKFTNNELKKVNDYTSRLITKNEFENISDVFSWRFCKVHYYIDYMNPSYGYVHSNGFISTISPGLHDINNIAVRPVINVYKSALDNSQ